MELFLETARPFALSGPEELAEKRLRRLQRRARRRGSPSLSLRVLNHGGAAAQTAAITTRLVRRVRGRRTREALATIRVAQRLPCFHRRSPLCLRCERVIGACGIFFASQASIMPRVMRVINNF